jgi:hypothetical protein
MTTLPRLQIGDRVRIVYSTGPVTIDQYGTIQRAFRLSDLYDVIVDGHTDPCILVHQDLVLETPAPALIPDRVTK